MKRYLVFFGDYYYPSGGMDDFLNDFDDKNEAIQALEKEAGSQNRSYIWGHVWDSKEKNKIHNLNN